MARCGVTIATVLLAALCFKLGSCEEERCGDLNPELNIPCFCSLNSENGIEINCDKVVFYRDLPLLPHRSKIHSFSSRESGIQDLGAMIFTAFDIPLKRVDFSHNLIRRFTKRMLDGLEDSLEELYFSHNLLGDNLEPVFETSEFNKLRNLKILDLSANGIKDVGRNVFDGLVSLQKLVLKDNNLQYVPTIAIQNLIGLKTLYLDGNDIYDLQRGAFGLMNHLLTLDLSRNFISRIQTGAFAGLIRANAINLSKNKLKNLQQDVFEGLIKLGELDLSDNFFIEIPLRALQGLKDLHKLVLHSNKIRFTKKGSLSSLDNLQYLDLSRNQIGLLSGDPFSGLTKLKSLNLNVNGISKIDVNLFSNLNDLESLSLDDYNLFEVPKDALKNLKNLKTISLNHNRIAAISPVIMEGVEHVEELSLAFNIIRLIPDGTFKNFKNLILLNLHGNQIRRISPKTFSGLEKSLRFMDLGFNGISQLPKLDFASMFILSLAMNQIESPSNETFKVMTELRHLNLSGNFIEELVPHLFDPVSNLDNLDLSNNIIFNLTTDVFHNLPLKKLNLAKNGLRNVEEEAFKDMKIIERIDLSFNNLKTINKNTFMNLPKLKELDISYNKIQRFDSHSFNNTYSIEDLNLGFNSISSTNPKAFEIQKHLKRLQLPYNLLTDVPAESIHQCEYLDELNLQNNQLGAIGQTDFTAMKKLRILNMENNHILTIAETALQNCSQLQFVNLKNNRISSLKEKTFMGLARLNLDLQHNELSSFPNDIFTNYNSLRLESLNVASNKFINFPEDALNLQYSYLERLNVSDNKIMSLENSDILVNVKSLDISNNPLNRESIQILLGEPKTALELYLRNVTLQEIPELETRYLRKLILADNDISRIRASDFEKVGSLEVLDISNNKMMNLTKNVGTLWSKLPNLKYLDLSKNPFRRVTYRDLSPLPRLEVLKISHLEKLEAFDGDSFGDLKNLKVLDMHTYPQRFGMNVQSALKNLEGLQSIHIELKDPQLNTQLHPIYSSRLSDVHVLGKSIQSVSSSAFAGITNPDVDLSLINTGITDLPKTVFIPLPLSSKILMNVSGSNLHSLGHQLLNTLDSKQRTINLVGLDTNQILCDCKLKPFWRWLKNQIETGQQIDQSIEDVTCYDPEPLRDKIVKGLQESDLSCDPNVPKRTTLPHPRKVNSRGSRSRRDGLNNMDMMIIGIVVGVVVFVLILIIIIIVLRLRHRDWNQARDPYQGPYTVPHGYCTCVKPPGAHHHSNRPCTCCAPQQLPVPPPRSYSTLPPKQRYNNPPPYHPPQYFASIPRGYSLQVPPHYKQREYKK